jgi:CubicO group peptidase (beta-lactamase class C family)
MGHTAAKTPLASVRKSLLSALIGNAVARGEIDLKATIGNLGIDDNEPSLTAEEKTATVRDLLKARSGVYHAALFETPSMAAQRPPRHSHPPGTFWVLQQLGLQHARHDLRARDAPFDLRRVRH